MTLRLYLRTSAALLGRSSTDQPDERFCAAASRTAALLVGPAKLGGTDHALPSSCTLCIARRRVNTGCVRPINRADALAQAGSPDGSSGVAERRTATYRLGSVRGTAEAQRSSAAAKTDIKRRDVSALRAAPCSRLAVAFRTDPAPGAKPAASEAEESAVATPPSSCGSGEDELGAHEV